MNDPAGTVIVIVAESSRVYVASVEPTFTPPVAGTPMNPSPVNVTDAPTVVSSVFDPCGACQDQRAMRSAAATPPALVKLPPT